MLHIIARLTASNVELALLGRLYHQIVSLIMFSWLTPDIYICISVMLRPTERPDVFSVIGGGQETDVESALQSRAGLIKFIEDVTNRREWQFGELKYLSEWR